MGYQERTCCCCIPLKVAVIIILVITGFSLMGHLWSVVFQWYELGRWILALPLIVPTITLSVVVCCKPEEEQPRKINFYCWLIYAIISVIGTLVYLGQIGPITDAICADYDNRTKIFGPR